MKLTMHLDTTSKAAHRLLPNSQEALTMIVRFATLIFGTLLGLAACGDDSRPTHKNALAQIEQFQKDTFPKEGYLSPFFTDAYTYDNGQSMNATHYTVSATVTRRWTESQDSVKATLAEDMTRHGALLKDFDKEYHFSKGDIYQTKKLSCEFVKTENGWFLDTALRHSSDCFYIEGDVDSH